MEITRQPLTFRDLQVRLLEHLRNRLRAGEITERGLSRISGISQPHIHNVLKGKREMSVGTSDTLLFHLRLDIRDLVKPPSPDTRRG